MVVLAPPSRLGPEGAAASPPLSQPREGAYHTPVMLRGLQGGAVKVPPRGGRCPQQGEGSCLLTPGSLLRAPNSRVSLQGPHCRLFTPGSSLQAPHSRVLTPGASLQGPHSGVSLQGLTPGPSLRSLTPGPSVQGPHSGALTPGSHSGALTPGSHSGALTPGSHSRALTPGSHSRTHSGVLIAGSSLQGPHSRVLTPGVSLRGRAAGSVCSSLSCFGQGRISPASSMSLDPDSWPP